VDETKCGDIIISRRSGTATCVITRVIEDGDETGPIEYMGGFDVEDRALRLAAETNGRIWVRVDRGPLTRRL
jgi:hypothetical protein